VVAWLWKKDPISKKRMDEYADALGIEVGVYPYDEQAHRKML
jgi:hypothetical protein